MKRGIATHTAVLVILIAIFFGFALLLFFRFIVSSTTQANTLLCGLKKWNYCVEWLKTQYDSNKRPYDWNKQGPSGCEKEGIGVTEPKDGKDCGLK